MERVEPAQEEKVLKTKNKTGRERRGLCRLFFGLALGACFGRLQLPLAIFPAGIAFCGAWLKSGIPGGFVVLLVTFFSLLTALTGADFFLRILLYFIFLLGVALAVGKRYLLVRGV